MLSLADGTGWDPVIAARVFCRGITHTPITIKAKAIPQGQQLSSLIFMSPLYNVS